MSIKRINEFPEGSGSLSNDDIFLFMDDPSGAGVTKKISLSQISAAIGGGGGGNPFQIGNIDLHNGGIQSAQILQFNDVTKQSVITGPTPDADTNAQRIIIQGQKGQGNGEGGDVYVWGGDADVNGGDIKIYAGDADSNESGYGGYVNIDAGNGYNQGGNVSISAGNSSTQGGNVTISAGNGSVSNGIVSILTNGEGISFSGVSIIGSGTGSGDGNNKGTIELVPDNTLYNNDQYLIVDPTGPNHVHLRAGGNQDNSQAELIVGGELANLRITDYNHQATINTAITNIVATIDNTFVYSCMNSQIGSFDFIPVGSTFTVDNVTYTITSINDESELGEGYKYSITPSPCVDEVYNENIIGTTTFTLPSPETHSWTFQNDGNLSIPGNISLSNGTSVAVGTYDNGTGGNNGISLNCSVGYELNWQGGHLRSSEIGNSSVTQPIFVDSPLQFPGSGVNYMTVGSSGLAFPDGTTQISAATGGLSDSNTYIICQTGDDLIAKYAAAKNLTPGGNALSATNRAALIIMPGNYSLSEELVIDAEFVDILGLGSMKLDRGCVTAVTLLTNTINVTANDVRVKGISVGTQSFKIGNDLPLQIIEDCVGGDYSFGSATIVSGVFINCSAGQASFGTSTESGAGTASGYFINCISGDQGFAGGGTANGTFKNCLGLTNSFGGNGGTSSGFFEYCTGGNSSFGGEGGVASGKFISCRLTSGTFPTLSGTGKIRLCIDGNYDVINADAP